MKLLTASGKLTPAGFACGYLEKKKKGEKEITLWMEHECYHVRGHDFAEHGRLFWKSFRFLGEARRCLHLEFRKL